MEDNNDNTGSDSDSNTVEEDSQDYYEPISSIDLDSTNNNDDDNGFSHHSLSNGHCIISETEDGFSSLTINEETEPKSDNEEEAEAEEAQETEDDEQRRRRSILMAENANTVMEAMRAISFPGTAPPWASDVNWIDQLQRLRSHN